jgi:hypothetical protein
MSKTSRDKYENDLKRLASVFTGSNTNSLPKAFKDIRLQEIRHKKFINYFCETDTKKDFGDDSHSKNILDQPIIVQSLNTNGTAMMYVEIIKEYITNMETFEKRMMTHMRNMFQRIESVDPATNQLSQSFRINPKCNNTILENMTNEVRDECVDFLIQCEQNFQKAMRLYKQMVIQQFQQRIRVDRQRDMATDPQKFNYMNNELNLWINLTQSTQNAY